MKQVYLKFSMLLLCLVAGLSSAWAASPWEVTQFSGTIANNSITINDATWTVKDMTVGSDANGAPAMTISSKKLKFGASKNQFWNSYTLSTDYFKDYNVTKVVVGCYDNGGTDSEITVTQGGVTIGSATVSTTTATNVATLNAASGKGGTLDIKFTSTKQASYITSISVYYLKEGAGEVKVTGVSLDKSSVEIEEGLVADIVATVTPNDATDKTLIWTSSDESIAKVVDGKVTALAEGSATITATTYDGGFYATCTVTVTKAIDPNEYQFLFSCGDGSDGDTNSSWSKSSALDKVFAEGYQYISSITELNNVYAARNTLGYGVKFGSSSAGGKITFELKKPVKATFIVVSAAAYGDTEGMEGFTVNGTSVSMAASQNKVYCDYVVKLNGSDLTTITVSQNKASKGRIYVKGIKLIKEDAPYYGTSALKLTAKDGAYYGTFSSSNVTFFPEDYTVSAIGVENGKLYQFDNDEAFDDGIVEINGKEVVGYYVPANTGVLVTSIENMVNYYTVEGVTPGTDNEEVNMLRPASASMTGDYKFYKLAYNDYEAATDLGFYYGAAEGAKFTCPAGRAYLAVPTESAAKSFVLNPSATAIENVNNSTSSSVIYNLAGQRLSQLQKGINIVDGKKLFVK